MSCDLSDPAISQAYEEIVSGQDTNWLILGYHDTRDKISLYSKGSGGLDELRNNLREEVLYGFLRIENRFVLLTYVSEQVSGVRRARALVHGRAVGALFKAHQIQISASTPGDLSEANVRNRLKLGAGDERPSSPGPNRGQSRTATLPSSPRQQSPTTQQILQKSPVTSEPEQDNSVEIARQEAERAAREEAERQARETSQRKEAEKLAQEAAKKRAYDEAERKKQDVQENQKKERALAEAKARSDAEKKAREVMEMKRNEEYRTKYAELEKSGKVLLAGYITVQGGGVYFWKRRYFELRGQTLHLYRDPTDKLPISKIELANEVAGVSDAQSEVLILHSFKVDFRSTEPYYFFSDDRKTKDSFVQAIARYVK